MMAEWEGIKVPSRTKKLLKQISKNQHRPMYKIIADALEGQMGIKNMRLMEIEEHLIGISDLVAALWKKKNQLNLSNEEVYTIIDKMSTVLADQIDKFTNQIPDDLPDDIRARLERMKHQREAGD